MPPPQDSRSPKKMGQEVELKNLDVSPVVSWSFLSIFSFFSSKKEPPKSVLLESPSSSVTKHPIHSVPSSESVQNNILLSYLQSTFTELRTKRTHMPDDVFQQYQRRYCKDRKIDIAKAVAFLNEDLAILKKDYEQNICLDKITIERQYYILAIIKAICVNVTDKYRNDEYQAMENELKYTGVLGDDEKGRKFFAAFRFNLHRKEFVVANWGDDTGFARTKFMAELNSLATKIYQKTEKYRETTHGIKTEENNKISSKQEAPSPSASRLRL